MHDVETLTVVQVNAHEKGTDDNSSNGNLLPQDPVDPIRRRLKQRHIQM